MENQFKSKTSAAILIDKFESSIYLFKTTFKHDKKIRQEIYLAISLIPLGLLVGETLSQKFLLVSSVLITVIIEFLKHLIQAAVDTISFENIYLTRYLKNVVTVAVFLAIINLFLTWVFILFL